MRTVTVADLRAIAGGPAPLASKLVGPINTHAASQGITTPLRMAHFLAHMAEETDGFRALVENLNYTSAARIRQVWPSRFKTDAAAKPFVRKPEALAEKVYGRRLGNTAPGDGWRYRGGGAYMLTGRDNYRRFGAAAGIDLEGNPELARDPETAIEVAARYFAARMTAAADRDDIEGTTRALNGALTNLAARRTYLARAKSAFGVMAAPAKVSGGKDASRASKADLMRLQGMLRDLGYAEVGMVDGKWGSRTRGALLAFKADNGLPVSTELDEATWAALARAAPREVSTARAEAKTAPSAAAKAAQATKLIGGTAAGVGAADAALEPAGGISGFLGWLTGIGDMVGSFTGALAPFRDLFASLAGNWPLLLLIGGAILFLVGRHIFRDEVESYRAGEWS
ncbi:putative chitinase [Chelatococcus caeni]|uniref:Putative chitinase n=1 Tax=Chelatococcus caeni TaxID=1348468 RepID=A0A840BWS7_9HYPH|nr:peptidoglycan-binding protein [Chelatococcus caeni]MBB4017400.1 putative chitinase [Chelatococcus caeni]